MKPRLFLCLDGQNVGGPFGLDELRLAVARHEVSKATLACEEGTEAWQPLGELRPEAFKRAEKKASPKQKALLAYLGHPAPDMMTSAEASAWLDYASQDDAKQELLSQWHEARLRLHPDLFAKELADKEEEKREREIETKAERARTICEFCNEEKEGLDGIDPSFWPLRSLTIKQCQQAVDWLDKSRPGWDANFYEDEFGSIEHDFICTTFVEALTAVAPSAVKENKASKRGKAKKDKRKGGCFRALLLLVMFFIALVAMATCAARY